MLRILRRLFRRSALPNLLPRVIAERAAVAGPDGIGVVRLTVQGIGERGELVVVRLTLPAKLAGELGDELVMASVRHELATEG